MDMHVGLDCQYASSTTETDINEFLGDKRESLLLGSYAYFSREKYAPPLPAADKKMAYVTFQLLYHDLITAARVSGFELVQKGRVPDSQLKKLKDTSRSGHPLDAWDLICGRYYTYGSRLGRHATKEDCCSIGTDNANPGMPDITDYRRTKLHGDRWNTRGPLGKSMLRKRNTNKATNKDDCCR